MLSFVCFLRMTHKKLKLNFISAAIQLLIAIWCFLIKTCYYTQRIVFFRSCCTSRNLYFQPNYPIARRRRNHCMVELGGVGVPTYRNRVVIFLFFLFWPVGHSFQCIHNLKVRQQFRALKLNVGTSCPPMNLSGPRRPWQIGLRCSSIMFIKDVPLRCSSKMFI